MGRYPKQQWQSGITASPYGPVSGPRLQHFDDWLDTIFNDFDAHVAAADAHPQYLRTPASPVVNGPLLYTASGWVSAKLTKDQLDPAAGILKTQLAPLGVVDADVNSISYAKLALAGQIRLTDLHPSLQGGLAPPGVMADYGGDTAPSGWLLCDGTTYDGTNTTYTPLWNAIGNRYGGSGQAAFMVPDKRGRMAVMKGSHTDVDTLGKSDGVAVANRRPAHAHNHSLTLPNHVHSLNDPGHLHYASTNADGGPFMGHPSSGSDLDGSHYAHSSTTGITQGNPTTLPAISGTVGPAGMTDSPAFIVVNTLIKL